jgi:hypothetical protein
MWLVDWKKTIVPLTLFNADFHQEHGLQPLYNGSKAGIPKGRD